MKFSSIIKAIITVILILAVLTALGFAFVPSVFTSLDNGNEKKCYENSKKLLALLEQKMTADEENKFWYDLVAERNSSKLLNAVNREMEESVDISSYYVKFSSDSVVLLCRNHPQVLDVSMEIPDHMVHYEREYEAPHSEIVTAIKAEGKNIYFQNSRLDAENPSKMYFTNDDDTNALFSDITVSALYAAGGERVLESDEYKILTGELDMTQIGSYTLRIVYTGTEWNTIFTTFDIDVIPNDKREPLIADGGSEGKYELASWVWTDYVSDALDEPGDYMEFTASIVYDKGEYYYFPDGFAILKDNKNNGSLAGAVDLENHNKQAYYIIFDTESGVHTDNVAQTLTHEGKMRVSDGAVYIWQNQGSRDFPRGWLRVYCEMTRLDD